MINESFESLSLIEKMFRMKNLNTRSFLTATVISHLLTNLEGRIIYLYYNNTIMRAACNHWVSSSSRLT